MKAPANRLPMGTLNDVLLRIEAGKSPQASDKPAAAGETGVLKVSAVTWNLFDAGKNKAVFSGFDATGVPCPMRGDLLISRANTVDLIGAVVVVEEDHPNLILSDKILRLIPDVTRADGKYLMYAMRSRAARSHLEGRATGTSGSMRNISQDTIRRTPIPLPPLSEQKRIAEILDRAEALRAKRRAALALLDELTQSIFLDMFGDPVSNPMGWESVAFESQIQSVRYGTGSPPDYVEEGIPFIRATNIKRGTVLPKDLKRISQVDADRISKCKVWAGDMIVVRSGVNTGDAAVISDELDGACAAFDLIVELNPNSAVFYNFLINSPHGKRMLSPLTRRAAQPHLNADQLRTLVLIAPPMELREEFVARVKAVNKLRKLHADSQVELDQLFASLQHRAFRGEL